MFNNNKMTKDYQVKNIVTILALVAAIVMGGLLATEKTATSASSLSEDQVNSMIEAWVRNNGNVLLDTLNATVEKQRIEQGQAQFENAFKNPIKDVVTEDNPVIGPKDAPITIIEYSDFECPFCKRGYDNVKQVMARYPSQIKLVYKHFPLESIHPNARAAGRASHAAFKQGKFQEFHDALFDRQRFIGEELFVDIAKELNLDMDKFNKDRNSDELNKQVDKDMAEGAKVGVQGTPFFIINGVPLNGAQPVEQFVQVIERLLNENDKK